MKVLHLISGGDSGGAKTHVFTLLDKLKNLAEVKVGCLIDGVFYEELKAKRDVESVLYRQRTRFDLSVVGDIVKTIEEGRFDILHVHGARANFVAGFVMKKTHVPVVTTMHSDYLLDFDSIVKKIVFTNLNKYALGKIPYFIAVSDNFKLMLASRGFRPNRIFAVYNGMDFSKVPKNPTPKDEYARRHGFAYDASKVYIGIAARFDTVKGVDVFIKAAGETIKRDPGVIFLIAGDGAERDKLKELADATGVSDRIRFLGYENDIYGFLNLIDINCLTSRCESFPYSMLEGAAMGKPMVASRVGGIPSLVIDRKTGFLFESENYKELSEKLLILSGDAALRREMGKNIYERATGLFSSDKFAADHMEIYKRILADYRSKSEYDFVISGYYGFGNNGDDALLLAITEDIAKHKPDARIAVLSNNPQETKMTYLTDAVSRVNVPKIIKTMKKSRVLISGGGSLLQDVTSSKSLWYYLFIIWLAKKCKLRVIQLANGFGPVTKKKNIALTRDVINSSVDVITLRDEESKKKMDEIGVTVKKIVTSDPAMLLKCRDDARANEILKENGIPAGKYFTVSLREWKDASPDIEETIRISLTRLCEREGLTAIFIPMQHPNDCAVSERCAASLGKNGCAVKKKLPIKDTICLIASAELNIAMRLHAMIYSVSEGVRTAALRYDPKIEGFMRCAGIENCADVRNITAERLDELIDTALNSPPPDGEALTKKAEMNTKIALELLALEE